MKSADSFSLYSSVDPLYTSTISLPFVAKMIFLLGPPKHTPDIPFPGKRIFDKTFDVLEFETRTHRFFQNVTN